jgi:hypothetical protein
MNKIEKRMVERINFHISTFIKTAPELKDKNKKFLESYVEDMACECEGMIQMLQTFLMDRYGSFERYRNSKDYKRIIEIRDNVREATVESILKIREA